MPGKSISESRVRRPGNLEWDALIITWVFTYPHNFGLERYFFLRQRSSHSIGMEGLAGYHQGDHGQDLADGEVDTQVGTETERLEECFLVFPYEPDFRDGPIRTLRNLRAVKIQAVEFRGELHFFHFRFVGFFLPPPSKTLIKRPFNGWVLHQDVSWISC